MKCLSLTVLSLLIGANSQSCNYGMADLWLWYVPASEDYCQDVYFPKSIFGSEFSLSYQFSCDYSGSSAQGNITTWDTNDCSGTPMNSTQIENGFFRCCQECDDACDWLYFNGLLYNNHECNNFNSHIVYDFAFLDWTSNGNISLGNNTIYSMVYDGSNDLVFTTRTQNSNGGINTTESSIFILECVISINGTYFSSIISDDEFEYTTTTSTIATSTTATATIAMSTSDDGSGGNSDDTVNLRCGNSNNNIVKLFVLVLSLLSAVSM